MQDGDPPETGHEQRKEEEGSRAEAEKMHRTRDGGRERHEDLPSTAVLDVEQVEEVGREDVHEGEGRVHAGRSRDDDLPRRQRENGQDGDGEVGALEAPGEERPQRHDAEAEEHGRESQHGFREAEQLGGKREHVEEGERAKVDHARREERVAMVENALHGERRDVLVAVKAHVAEVAGPKPEADEKEQDDENGSHDAGL